LNIGLSAPWALILGITALIPLLKRGQAAISYPSISMLPSDPLSTMLDRLLRSSAAAAALSLSLGIAGPYLHEQWVERVGTGAHIVLLLDRSSSMNENFSGSYMGGRAQETKGAIARKLLAEFVARREHDLFAMIDFSAAPIYVMPFTQDRPAILAAIEATSGRGHGVTNIAPGLAMALDFYSGKPFTGSRIVLLVSDGAARIEEETRDQLRQWFQETQATLYWIYLRNPRSGRLSEKPVNPGESTTPEYFLHQYFQNLGVPYRAFEAENPEALQRAILEVEQLENLPLHYLEKLPRRDISGYCYAAALAFLALLLSAKALEVKSWPA
jgi:mxaC protein